MSPEIPKGKSAEDLSSLSREELALRAAQATNPDEVGKITEAIKNLHKAKGEAPKPDAVTPLSREEIIDQIKRASREGDLNKIKRLNELLTPAAPQGPLLSAQEIQVKKMGIEPAAGTGGEKKELTEEEKRTLSQRRAGFVGAEKRTGHAEKTEKGWQLDDSIKERAKKEMEAGLAQKPAAQEASLSREELLRQMTDAMKRRDVKETHRLSEALNPKPHESVKKDDENIPTSPAEIRAAQQEWDRNERKAVENEIKKLSPEERTEAKIGLRNFGFWVAEKKDLFWAKVCTAPAKAFGEKGTMGRFFSSLKENFERDAKKSRADFERAAKEKRGGVRSTLSLAGNALKYGRSAADIVGWTVASPLRYVMMGGMFFARGAEAAKEARLKNEEVIERTRIDDINTAAEEAWKIYTGAKERADGKTPSREDIESAYREKIPQDILKRLTENPLPDISTTLLQRILEHDVERSAQKIQKKIEAIDEKEIPTKAKQKEKDRIIKKYEKHLKDLDRMVTQYGTVDGLALGAKYAETAGKAAVAGMMAESLVLAAQHLWERGIPNIFSRTDEFLKKSGVEAPGAPKGVDLTSTEAIERYRQLLGTELTTKIGRNVTTKEINTILDAQKRGLVSAEAMQKILDEMKQAPEGGLKKEDIDWIIGRKESPSAFELQGEAPPETPIAPPDEEAKIGHAIKEPTGAEMKGAIEFTPEQLREFVKSGDSVWKNVERKLEALYGTEFAKLNPAQKTFAIDWIKDEISDRLKEQGLNPDKLKIGQELDYSGILDNKEKMASIFGRANELDHAMQDSINKNSKMIADWAREHPREALTSERVEEILRAKPVRAEIPTDYTHDAGPTRHENFYNGVSLPEAEAYGSRESAFFAKLAGLSEHEYKTIRTVKIRDILEQIPSEKEARIIWEGQIPGRTINLPSFEQYDKNEFEGHVRLAQILRHYIEGHPHEAIFSNMTVDDFFKVAAPEEGPVFRGATPPDFLEPEEFAQKGPQTVATPHTPDVTPTADIPADQMVGQVRVEGKDIAAYGTAEEAFVAKNRLGMIPREWQDIKSLETRNLLSQTPEGAAKMNPEQLRQWYETQKPKLPGTSFDSFRKQALLADAIRESLKTKDDPEYLKSLPVRELVRNFVLAETGKGGSTLETVEETIDPNRGVQAP